MIFLSSFFFHKSCVKWLVKRTSCTVFCEAQTQLVVVCCRGDPGRRRRTAARELRRQSGRRLRDLQWIRWVQKGEGPRVGQCWRSAASTTDFWEQICHIMCRLLCSFCVLCCFFFFFFPGLVLRSVSLISALLWKELLITVCCAAVRGRPLYLAPFLFFFLFFF